MDVFASYVDEDELNESEEEKVNESVAAAPSFDASSVATLLPLSVDLAPSVTPILGLGAFARADAKEVTFNPRVDTLYAPVQGPATLPPGVRRDTVNNTPTGHVERTNLNGFLFDQQYHTFHSYGFAADPTVNAHTRAMVGNVERLQAKDSTSVFDPSPSARQLRKQFKKKRAQSGDPGTEEYLGPWAPPTDEKAAAQLTEEEVAAYEAWKPISKKKRKQMERQAMLAEEGEGEEEQEEPEKPKKEKKKKKKKNIETVFEEEAPSSAAGGRDDDSDDDQPRSAPASRVGPSRPPANAQVEEEDDDEDN